MKLTLDQIKSVTAGALRVEQEADGIHFYKCTEKQIAFWYSEREVLGERALCTTGVRLDFHTDSRRITFRAAKGEKYELHVDGLIRHAILMSEQEDRTASFELKGMLGEDKGSYRVTVVFPAHGAAGVLDWIELDDGATVTPHAFDTRMLFIGDSITQGHASGLDSLSYAYRVSSFFNAESVNQGIGGAYFHEGGFDSVAFDPDTVIVAYGTNDFGHYPTQAEMRTHVRAHLELIAKEYRAKRVIVISPIWRGVQTKPMGSFSEARAIVISEAERLGLEHIDGLTLVPPLPDMFLTDMLHPNSRGFACYAENLLAQMIK